MWQNFIDKLSENPVAIIAAYAAIVSTASFLLALMLAVQSSKKSKRDAGILNIDRADAGVVTQTNFSYHTFVMNIINTGGPTVSITQYELAVYTGLINWVFKKTPVLHRGDGWRVTRGATSFNLSLPEGASPPFALKSGEPTRLEIHTERIWNDSRFRRVVWRVWHSHSPKPQVVKFKPLLPFSYLDSAGIADEQQKLLLGTSNAKYKRHSYTVEGWQTVEKRE